VCHVLTHISLAVMALLPSEMIAPWAPGISHVVSRPCPRGSHVRRPTHRRGGYPQRRKALLPACRAQLWPGGFRAHWTTYRISVGIATSFPFGPALPGRFYHQTLFNGGGKVRGDPDSSQWMRRGRWPGSIVVRELFSLAGRPSTEHICQYSSAEDLWTQDRSCAGYV